jgi:hypothetical protein
VDLIEIADWNKYYENNRSREIKETEWVPLPNKQGGDGYTELLDHPNGSAHYGAWCALLAVASKCSYVGNISRTLLRESADAVGSIPHPPAGECPDPAEHPFGRGILMRSTGIPHDTRSISRLTRIPEKIIAETIPRLLNIGWIKIYKIPHNPAPGCDLVPSTSAVNRRRLRKSDYLNRTELEEDKTLSTMAASEETIFPAEDAADASACTPSTGNGTSLFKMIEAAFLSKNDDKFSNYGKEGKAINGLIAKAKARAPDGEAAFLVSMLDGFWKLKCSSDKFWHGQPFLPSALNASGIWDRVLETMRNEEALADPVAMAVARGERI